MVAAVKRVYVLLLFHRTVIHIYKVTRNSIKGPHRPPTKPTHHGVALGRVCTLNAAGFFVKHFKHFKFFPKDLKARKGGFLFLLALL